MEGFCNSVGEVVGQEEEEDLSHGVVGEGETEETEEEGGGQGDDDPD